MIFARRRILLTGLALAAAAVQVPLRSVAAASASQSAAAVVPIQQLDAALLDVMKNAQGLKFQGRYDKLQPILAAVFDIPEMARVAVGPTWTKLSDADRAAMTDVFARYMTTMYAARFNGYDGETFDMGEAKLRDDGRVLVATKLNRKGQDAVDLSYLLRGDGGAWHVVDVYYNGAISQVVQLRSEFSSPLRDGGVAKLRSVLETKIKELQT